jgi:hypothetical protein
MEQAKLAPGEEEKGWESLFWRDRVAESWGLPAGTKKGVGSLCLEAHAKDCPQTSSADATPSGLFSRRILHRPLEIKLPVNLGDNLLSPLAIFFSYQNKASI